MLIYNTNYQYHPTEKIIVIWQAKGACSFVNYMYFYHENLLTKALEYSHWIHDYRQYHTLKTKKIRNQGLNNPITKYIHFCVNPYKRAVSSYIHSQRHKYIHPRFHNVSFYAFLNGLKTNHIEPNPHHNLQSFFLKDTKSIEYIHMENIEDKIQYLKQKYNLNYVNPEKSHKHTSVKTNCDNTFLGYTKWDTIENNLPIHYKVFYNDDIRKLVEELYQVDIQTLKYTWEMFINTSS